MIGIAFWNMHNNSRIDDMLVEMILEKKIDIMLMAEYASDPEGLCNKLSVKGKDFRVLPEVACEKIKIIADKKIHVDSITEESRYTIRSYKFADMQFLIVAVHFPSKMYAQSWDHVGTAMNMIRTIEEVEQEEGHSNTIVIGDFNANPFEEMCINANCFHAVPNAQIALKTSRISNGKECKMFYNPMWNFFGDYGKTGGTYYRTSSNEKEYFWNIFDQVIFRPQLIKNIPMKSIEIITQIGKESLLNRNGIPQKTKYSDHLPICFRMKEDT